jgi:hypothetical protein
MDIPWLSHGFPMDSPSPPLRSGRVLFTAAPSPTSLVPSRSSEDVVELGVAAVAVVAVVAVVALRFWLETKDFIGDSQE